MRSGLQRAALLEQLAEPDGWDALVVRSQTRVDAELLAAAAPRLSVIGVASVGTDRIDLAEATRAGVMVVNAPTGNTIAAAEHTMALMLALLRRVPGADASVRGGEWDRARFTGAELRHKTLGIIGLGKIGKAVARRASGFEMRVVTHDPYLTEEQAAEHGARLVGLPELLLRADVITVHTPLTAQTRGLIGPAQIEAMKPGAVLLNVARGGIVDEAALAAALREGRLAGAAVDVYSAEPMAPDNPLRDAPNTVLTPHLGASTAEAQDRVAVEMAEQLVEALAGVTPTVRRQRAVGRRRCRASPASVRRARAPAGDPGPAAVAGGLRLHRADVCRRDRGLGLLADPHRRAGRHPGGHHRSARERRQCRPGRPRARPDRARDTDRCVRPVGLPRHARGGRGHDALRLAGSTAHGRPHLAASTASTIDAELAGLMLVTRHRDQPGIVGAVGTALADAGVNISSLELSRLSAQGDAMMFVSVDSPIPEPLLDGLRSVAGMREARVVELPPPGP